jgi:hypothetical protein
MDAKVSLFPEFHSDRITYQYYEDQENFKTINLATPSQMENQWSPIRF